MPDHTLPERWLASLRQQMLWLERNLEFHILANHLMANIKAMLFAGLFYIHDAYVERQLHEVADIDAALLADDLPPQAYADPGFAAFLKAAGR